MILLEDLGMKDLGGYRKRMCIAQCKQCGDTSEKQYIQVVGKEDVLCKSCAVSNRHKARDDYKESESRMYYIFSNMHTRCYNENYNTTKNYMTKGIIVCSGWYKNFKAFKEWALSNGYSETLSLDRIDNDGNYEPSNCRWADSFTQAQNKSRLRKDNKTGFTNVSFVDNKYLATITVNKQMFNLGRYETAREAAIAYNNFVIENRLEHQLNKGV